MDVPQPHIKHATKKQRPARPITLARTDTIKAPENEMKKATYFLTSVPKIRCLTLPLYHELTESEQQIVVDSLKKFL
jgi:dTDP-4-amino-4,6-dideoxygalactose transaminase